MLLKLALANNIPMAWFSAGASFHFQLFYRGFLSVFSFQVQEKKVKTSNLGIRVKKILDSAIYKF